MVHPAGGLGHHCVPAGAPVANTDLRSGAGESDAVHAGRVLDHFPVLPRRPRAVLARQQPVADRAAVADEPDARARSRRRDGQAALAAHSRAPDARGFERASMSSLTRNCPPPPPPPIAAIATPPGRGGIGIVRVSGVDLTALIEGIAGRTLAARIASRVTFRDDSGATIDSGIALYFPQPHSYTGEDVVEWHGHGGPAVMRLLLSRCLELGGRLAEPGSCTKRACLNGKLDLAQAESVADVIEASTASAVRAAARSLTGEFSREVHALRDALIELRMYTEATLDFPDEELDLLREGDVQARLSSIRERLHAVLARARTGAVLREGLTVVLVGAPNVGKSSPLNRLPADDVAIVTA